MAANSYDPADVRAMFEQPVRVALGSHTDGALVALGSELRTYLRTAPGRTYASPAKISLGVAVLDVWTGYSSLPDQGAGSDHAEAAALVTIGAVTALTGAATDEAREVVLLARARTEQAIENSVGWQELWLMASELGSQTGFRLDIDAGRAERIWRALITFAANVSPLTFTDPPPNMPLLLSAVKARIEATGATALSKIKSAWPTHTSGAAADSALTSAPRDEPAEPWEMLGRAGSEEDARRLLVWFGTNRIPTTRRDVNSGYTNVLEPDGLFYGRCLVNVPAMQDATGGVRRIAAGWVRLGTPHGRRARVESHYRFSQQADFTHALQIQLAHNEDERTALVFIHGYNTSFDSAAASAAQLSVNIKHQGPTAMFSWASRAKLLGYRDDERTIVVSQPQLTEFLQTLTSIPEIDHIDVVVHSLGNRLLMRSLIEWFHHDPPTSIPLRNLFLGAPDIAHTEFLSAAATFAQAARKTTMYGSDSDSALLASKLLHGSARVGLMPPPALAAGIDTIESSAIDVSKLRHNGIVDAAAVQSDMYLIQDGSLDPDIRPNLRRVSSGLALPYWRF